jgi:hypothetical protein
MDPDSEYLYSFHFGKLYSIQKKHLLKNATFIQLLKNLWPALGPQTRECSSRGLAGMPCPRANLSRYGVEGGNCRSSLWE